MEIEEIHKDVQIKELLDKGKYRCQCVDCGKEFILTRQQLVTRKTNFCQCRVEKIERLQENLVGKKFGDLVVTDLDYEATAATKEKYGKRMLKWKCKCVKCQGETSKFKFELNHLAANHSSGCGHCYGINLIGQKFGRLIVIKDLGTKGYGERYWECICECGNHINVSHASLFRGNTKSCGCLHREQLAQRNKETAKWGGDSENPKYERIYRIWGAMRNRCYSPLNEHYDLYGGRGICVCDEWLDWNNFKNWALSNGYEEHLTIDRINGNGNYEPGNCRWATYEQQMNNVSTNRRVTYRGRTQTLSEWCKELDLDYSRTQSRLNSCNYSVEEAFELGKYATRQLKS